MEIHEVAVSKSADVSAAARRLVGNVDAIYVPTDNTVVAALAAITKVGIESKLPVFAGDTDSVLHGAVAALGFNYYDVGRQTGKIVVRVLKGENPGTIAVEGITPPSST
jgi:putative ABC transport system substrate-binding protein